jgi:hypothetical protein
MCPTSKAVENVPTNCDTTYPDTLIGKRDWARSPSARCARCPTAGLIDLKLRRDGRGAPLPELEHDDGGAVRM